MPSRKESTLNWVSPTAINGPNANPGVSWDGNLPEGCVVEGMYWAFSVGKVSGGTAMWPIVSLAARAWFNDGYGAIFESVKIRANLSPSSGKNYLLGFGGAMLPRPHRLTEHDKRVDVELFPPGILGNNSVGTGTYSIVTTGQVVDGDTFQLGTSLLVRLAEV